MLRNSLYRPWFLEDNKEKWGFQILEGEFKDVSILIENINFSENNDGDMQVDYEVVNPADFDSKNETFQAVFELIFNDIVKEAIDGYKQDEQNRANHTSSPS